MPVQCDISPNQLFSFRYDVFRHQAPDEQGRTRVVQLEIGRQTGFSVICITINTPVGTGMVGSDVHGWLASAGFPLVPVLSLRQDACQRRIDAMPGADAEP